MLDKDLASARPVRFSQVTITELMIPAYANFGGKIHGGILLSLMDKVAYAAASKHTVVPIVSPFLWTQWISFNPWK